MCFRIFIIFAGLLTAQLHAGERPNVILILSDDQGYGDVSFNGCEEIPTPALDSIAKQGVRFTNGYVTAPQCAPSRAGLLSGRYQNEFGRGHNHTIDAFGIPDEVPMFAQLMKQAGYATGMVGKWHQSAFPLAENPEDSPNERGFDYFYGHITGGTHYFPPEGEDSIPYLRRNGEPVSETRYLTNVFGEEAEAYIEQHARSEKPFFLYLSFNAPHTPLQAPEEYLERFAHLAGADDEPVHCGYTGRTIEHPRQVYAAMVAAMDDAVAGVLHAIERNGIEQDTLVFFLSDNGGPESSNGSDNGPLRGVKGDVLEGGIRVPFAVRWPGTIPPGQVIDTPVISLDLLPTALSASGALELMPSEADGIDLLPLLRDGKPLRERSLFWRFPHPPEQPELHVRAVRQGSWKYTEEWLRGPAARGREPFASGVYDLAADIDESEDLSELRPDRRAELLKQLRHWEARLPAPFTGDRKDAYGLSREEPQLRESVAPWLEAAETNGD